MATKEEKKKLAIKAIEDDAFRAELEKDPAKAARSLGITLTADEVKAITDQAASVKKVDSRESKSFIIF